MWPLFLIQTFNQNNGGGGKNSKIARKNINQNSHLALAIQMVQAYLASYLCGRRSWSGSLRRLQKVLLDTFYCIVLPQSYASLSRLYFFLHRNIHYQTAFQRENILPFYIFQRIYLSNCCPEL